MLLVDDCFMGSPEIAILEAQGHIVDFKDFSEYALVISPKAQMTPPGRLAYVVKKLKDIVKEVAK